MLADLGINIPKKDGFTIDLDRLFDLNIQMEAKERRGEDDEKYSPLRIRQQEQIIQQMKPTFPLYTYNMKEELKLTDAKEFIQQMRKIFEEKDPRSEHTDNLRTTDQLLIKQGIFNKRLERANEYFNEAFSHASKVFMNERVLYEQYRKQIRDERTVKGKPLLTLRPSNFEMRWKQFRGLRDHEGVAISKAGYRKDEKYMNREKRMAALRFKFGKTGGKKVEHCDSCQDDSVASETDSEELSPGKRQKKEKTQSASDSESAAESVQEKEQSATAGPVLPGLPAEEGVSPSRRGSLLLSL